MKRTQRFVPSSVDGLENRVVLSRTTQGLAVVVSGLSPHLKVLNRVQQAMSAEVQQAFATFQNDYGQARATYFASIQDTTSPSAATTNAFTLYTTQRVSLLGQQLINIFIQSPLGTSKGQKAPYALKSLVDSKIIGPQGQHPKGSLVNSLLATIPPAGTSQPTSSLYTLSQDNAIETAQVAVLNGLSIMKNSAFGLQKVSHY
jgi:hypothetical protein